MTASLLAAYCDGLAMRCQTRSPAGGGGGSCAPASATLHGAARGWSLLAVDLASQLVFSGPPVVTARRFIAMHLRAMAAWCWNGWVDACRRTRIGLKPVLDVLSRIALSVCRHMLADWNTAPVYCHTCGAAFACALWLPIYETVVLSVRFCVRFTWGKLPCVQLQ